MFTLLSDDVEVENYDTCLYRYEYEDLKGTGNQSIKVT